MKKDYARQYGDLQQWHWWFRGRRRIIETLLRQELPGDGPRRILSVGCGPGTGLAWLLPFAGARGKVVGLDIEELHARDLPAGVEFVVGALEDAPLPDASFDAVLALDVLEHLDDDAAGLRQAARLVKPGGLLLVTVPALPSLWGGQDVVSEHRRRYTKPELARLFERAALPGSKVTYFNTLLFPLIAPVRWARRAAGLSQRQRSDFEDGGPGLVNETLARIFAAESHLISRAPMPIGVSLVATYSPPHRAAVAG
jgi:SAM-dependent methyltransferase